MPGFNGSGTFVRTHNWVTDKANSVKVTASRMDTEDDGFATGLSTAICKDGQTTTTAAIPFAVGINISDGSAATPAIKFTNDTDCGWYRIGANNVGLSIGGSLVWDYGTATASAAGSLVVGGTLAVTGGVTAATATVSVFAATGAATFASTVGITGQLTAATATVSVFAATGAATLASTLGVTGAATLSSTLAVTGDVAVNTNKFNITAASGNTTIAGTLGVTGAATLSSTLGVTGAATVGGTLGVTATASAAVVVSAGAINAATVAGGMVATQAQQETGSATDVVVTSGRQHYHKSACKAWARITWTAGVPALTEGYNISATVADNGTGDFTLNFTNALSTATYGVVATPHLAGNSVFATIVSASTTQINIKVFSDAGGTTDPDAVSVVVFGDL